MRDRFVFLFLSAAIALSTSALSTATASAQSAPAWGTASAVELAPPSDERPPTETRHVVREKLLITGVSFLAVGYVASVVWGAAYLGSIALGPLSCNDQYAGWHFVPVVGPVLGMFSGASCIHDNLHFEEGLLPVVFSLTQLAGLIMTIVGALGRDVPDVPQFAFSADANGGYATLRGSF